MNCIILDDEPLAHQVLEHYIMETPGLTLVAKFRNAVEAYEYLGKHTIDILFLDIEMPLVNGVSFLQALPNPPKTIFTTAYKQYAFEGFELNALDYLLKPFSYERFITAIKKTEKVNSAPGPHSGTLAVKDKDGALILKQADVLYIEGCKDYIKIVTTEKTHIMYHTLKAILQKLDPSIFIQAHRSYLINKIHVIRISQNNLIFSNQTFVPIGESYKKELLLHINI
ncbi:LytR/AlgR family response regulator transcription factor [Pedobacter metabolipauper]|uniref:LytTR family two component transcriptional regulator n=1 Tax=Pedobacter metabolipauper TaxID=425513 RepID=A0A4R6T3B7_9SPHI|nr:LytTR family DNA-binding domain-containing protein [Pedobacter metabolipauper]TDQ11861.1 LytTR family two component transcriptional regulator [Pedobacter metabolipauper]